MNALIENLNEWGGVFFRVAWPMFWQSSVLIAFLFAGDRLWRHRLRASLRYALWLVVLVKLCVPPTFALPTSPAWWLHASAPSVVAKPDLPPTTVTYSEGAPLTLPPVAELPVFTPPPTRLTAAAWLLAVAVVISGGLLFWMVVRWWQVARLVRRSHTSAWLTGLADEARQALNVRSQVPVKLTAQAMSPAVCGLFQPVILIPQSLATNLSVEQLRAVLLHELIHLRRGDVWVNFIQTLLQIGYWWQPLVWLANARLRRVREEAVDDAVMLALSGEAETYAPTLLAVAKLSLNRPLATLGLVGIMESRSVLRQRIERLLDFHPPRQAGLTLVSLLGVLAFTAVAVPMGQGPSPAEKPVPAAPVVSRSSITWPLTNQPVLIMAAIYQMSDAELAATVKGLVLNRAEAGGDPCWAASPEQYRVLATDLAASGMQPLMRPRILTGSGKPAQMFMGEATNGIEFDCTPFVVGGRIEVTMAGRRENTVEASTNSFSAKAAIENSGGMVVWANHPDCAVKTKLVVVMSVELVANTSAMPGQGKLPSAVAATNFSGSLGDPKFRIAQRALEQRSGAESLREPEVMTASGRQTQLRAVNTKVNSIPTKMEAGQMVQEGKLFFEMGQLDRAEAQLNSALALEPGNAAAQYYLSLIQASRRERPEPKTNSTAPGRKQIVAKLSAIQFDHFGPYDGWPLDQVLQQVTEAIRQGDGGELRLAAAIKARKVIIHLPLALEKSSLLNGLEAVVGSASEAIKFSILDDGIIFSLKDAADPGELLTRTFKVDAKVVISQLRQIKEVGEDLGEATDAPAVAAAARKYFSWLGVNLESPVGKAVFFSDKSSVLLVKATEADLDIVERALSVLLCQVAPQIHIKARFYTVPKGTFRDLVQPSLLTTVPVNALKSETNAWAGLLADEKFRTVLPALDQKLEVEHLAEPEGTTLSGRQMQMKVTEPAIYVSEILAGKQLQIPGSRSNEAAYIPGFEIKTNSLEVGPSLDAVASVLSDGYTINLWTYASLTKFLGYEPYTDTNATGHQLNFEGTSPPKVSPHIQVQQASALLNLWDGQTLVLGQVDENSVFEKRLTKEGWLEVPQKKSRNKELLVFITVNLLDAAGNRIHGDDGMRFTAHGIPRQPSPAQK